jgi:hypothetical protein
VRWTRRSTSCRQRRRHEDHLEVADGGGGTVAERWWSLPKSTWRVLTLLAGLIARGFALEYTPPSAGVDLVWAFGSCSRRLTRLSSPSLSGGLQRDAVVRSRSRRRERSGHPRNIRPATRDDPGRAPSLYSWRSPRAPRATSDESHAFAKIICDLAMTTPMLPIRFPAMLTTRSAVLAELQSNEAFQQWPHESWKGATTRSPGRI